MEFNPNKIDVDAMAEEQAALAQGVEYAPEPDTEEFVVGDQTFHVERSMIYESPFGDEDFQDLPPVDQLDVADIAEDSAFIAGVSREIPQASAINVANAFYETGVTDTPEGDVVVPEKKLFSSRVMSWGRGITAAVIVGLGATLAPTDAYAGDRDHRSGNVLKDFGDNVARGVKKDIRAAGTDSGGVIGGAARVVIDRAVNTAVMRGLEVAGVPVQQTPEEVVVVPRSVPGVGMGMGGVGVYGGQVPIGGVRGGDRQYGHEQIGIQAQYAKKLHEIQTRWTEAQVQALYARQDAEMTSLNAQYSLQMERANEMQKHVVYTRWAAAKADLKVRHERQGPDGQIAQLNKWASDRGYNAAVDAQAREAYRRNEGHE